MSTATAIDPAELMDLLWDDEEGTTRDAAIARLDELRHGIKRTIDAGVTPAEFEALTKVYSGLEVAQGVVKDGWFVIRDLENQDA